jgi:hypothetical protein
LFDLKYVRDELFYYSRDENQFLRRRRAFVIILHADLIQARYKDASLPVQRIVLTIAAVAVLVQKLEEWLSHDALQVELIWMRTTEPPELQAEQELLERVLAEPMARGTVQQRSCNRPSEVARIVQQQATHSQTHALILSATPAAPDATFGKLSTVTTQVHIHEFPTVRDGHGDTCPRSAEEAMDAWSEMIETVLSLWI